MSNATSSTRSVIITKALCPRMSCACCASCTRMEPSSPTLELRGKEHSNCPPEAQRTVAPQLSPSRNSVFGLFVRRMGRRIGVVLANGLEQKTRAVFDLARDLAPLQKVDFLTDVLDKGYICILTRL